MGYMLQPTRQVGEIHINCGNVAALMNHLVG